jgi:predicted transcriptional regulator
MYKYIKQDKEKIDKKYGTKFRKEVSQVIVNHMNSNGITAYRVSQDAEMHYSTVQNILKGKNVAVYYLMQVLDYLKLPIKVGYE